MIAKAFGQKVGTLSFTLVGGILHLEMKRTSCLIQVLIYLGGIMVNIILVFLSRFIVDPYQRSLVYNYNLLLIFFNLIPIYPLDGFQILLTLSRYLKSPFIEFRITSIISYLFLAGLSAYVISQKYGLAAWIIPGFLAYYNLYLELNQNEFILKRIITNYQNYKDISP